MLRPVSPHYRVRIPWLEEGMCRFLHRTTTLVLLHLCLVHGLGWGGGFSRGTMLLHNARFRLLPHDVVQATGWQ